jgi:hypothetical protein
MCCGPCASYPIPALLDLGHKVRGLFYNPNIHPFQEYLLRQQGVERYAGILGIEVIYLPDYDIEKFFRETAYREGQRCRSCYYMRLLKAAQIARRGNFEAFTTTMLVSPFQKHDLIREIGEQVAEETGISFFYQDFRLGYKETVPRSKEMGLYRQQYCGCLFSERERYMPRKVMKKASSGTDPSL